MTKKEIFEEMQRRSNDFASRSLKARGAYRNGTFHEFLKKEAGNVRARYRKFAGIDDPGGNGDGTTEEPV